MSTPHKLVERWRSESDQYMRHVAEARALGTPHDQMLAMATALRQCAHELERALNVMETPTPK